MISDKDQITAKKKNTNLQQKHQWTSNNYKSLSMLPSR